MRLSTKVGSAGPGQTWQFIGQVLVKTGLMQVYMAADDGQEGLVMANGSDDSSGGQYQYVTIGTETVKMRRARLIPLFGPMMKVELFVKSHNIQNTKRRNNSTKKLDEKR